MIRCYIERVYAFSIRNRIRLQNVFFIACDDLLSLAVPVLFLEENRATPL